jgi:MFS family permease
MGMQPSHRLPVSLFLHDAGIFYIGYAVFQIPSNLIITRVGAPLWLGFLICAWGIVSACTATMKTKEQYYAVRFLLGGCLSPLSPSSNLQVPGDHESPVAF